MIRVLFIISDLSGGGAELSLLDLLERLNRRFIEPRLFLLFRSGVHLNRVPTDVPLSWGRKRPSRMRYGLLSIVRRALQHGRGVDIVVAGAEAWPSYIAWGVARLLRKPLVCWVKTDLDRYLDSWPAWHRILARFIYSHCDAAIVASNGSLRALHRLVTLPADKVHLIPNPVGFERVREKASEPLPADMKNLLTKPFVVAAGRLLVAQKGYDLLIRAHAAVQAQGVDHNLVILGEGEDQAFLQQLARSLSVEDSTFLLGFQPNPFPFFKAARALAAPSRLEGFGRTYLEAMALGLPVIGSTASGPADILMHGAYGISVPLEDADALASALHILLTDPVTHARYSELSLSRARDYIPEKVVSKWEDILRCLAAAA